MNIIWNKNIEPENKAEIEKYLNPFLFLVPKWCQELRIFLYPTSESGNSAIETETLYDYRAVKMTFFSAWLNESTEAKQMHVVHDLLHGFTSIFVDYAVNQIDTFCPVEESPKTNKSIQRQLSLLCESSTQDLAYAILNKFNENLSQKAGLLE